MPGWFQLWFCIDYVFWVNVLGVQDFCLFLSEEDTLFCRWISSCSRQGLRVVSRGVNLGFGELFIVFILEISLLFLQSIIVDWEKLVLNDSFPEKFLVIPDFSIFISQLLLALLRIQGHHINAYYFWIIHLFKVMSAWTF